MSSSGTRPHRTLHLVDDVACLADCQMHPHERAALLREQAPNAKPDDGPKGDERGALITPTHEARAALLTDRRRAAVRANIVTAKTMALSPWAGREAKNRSGNRGSEGCEKVMVARCRWKVRKPGDHKGRPYGAMIGACITPLPPAPCPRYRAARRCG